MDFPSVWRCPMVEACGGYPGQRSLGPLKSPVPPEPADKVVDPGPRTTTRCTFTWDGWDGWDRWVQQRQLRWSEHVISLEISWAWGSLGVGWYRHLISFNCISRFVFDSQLPSFGMIPAWYHCFSIPNHPLAGKGMPRPGHSAPKVIEALQDPYIRPQKNSSDARGSRWSSKPWSWYKFCRCFWD